MSEIDLDELASELEDFAPPEKATGRSARDERLIAGFEDIQRFVAQHGRLPSEHADADIFERLYAVRLERLRALPECEALLAPLDSQGLLSGDAVLPEPSLDELADELEAMLGEGSIQTLKHVRSSAEKRAAQEIADQTRCEDFEQFKPLFEEVERELKAGLRKSLPFEGDASIAQGNFFILSGQLTYVAEVGETIKTGKESDARLRVIYANGTESNLLLRSLQRALFGLRDNPKGRRITDTDFGPLFSGEFEEGDIESGTIYVLRSLSEHPYVAEHRDVIHKIGVTGGKVETRIAGAEHDATYLLAKVEVVATYKLAGINRVKMENLFHKLFANARLDISINDRFGQPVAPKEWFLVPLFVIDEAVKRIQDGSITDYHYDQGLAALVKG
ncbi:Conserved hypothetical protein [gamma proteobacterium HdN1]|nr:Conserved hypothetical protein [gamma proteobacterium HdN1]